MKFTLSWLKDHLDTHASVDEICEALTDLGLEVEGVENPAERLKSFTLGKVTHAEQHPDADRLACLHRADRRGQQADRLWRAQCADGDHYRALQTR